MFLSLLRWIPTPTYGNYGGAYRSRKDSKPKDWLDEKFQTHDLELRKQKDIIKEAKNKIKGIDQSLGREILTGDDRKLGIYGKIYLTITKFIFRG